MQRRTVPGTLPGQECALPPSETLAAPELASSGGRRASRSEPVPLLIATALLLSVHSLWRPLLPAVACTPLFASPSALLV